MQNINTIEAIKKKNIITYLRSAAVLLVLLYHLNFDIFNFGYLGVDIFFVISGCVITLSILKRKDEKNFLRNFLLARFDRIMPATIATVIFSFILSYFFFEPKLLRTNTQSIFSSLIYLSNYYYYLTIDYFSFKTDYFQLIHFWSLSLEIQFYILFSVMFVFSLFKRNLNFSLISIFLLSFFSFSFFNFVDQKLNFYFIGGRLWEFLIGAPYSY